MREFEILKLTEGEKLPTRSYRFPVRLMKAISEANKAIFEGQGDETKLISFFAAYGLMKWKESQVQQSESHQNIVTGSLKKQIEQENLRNRGKATGS